MNLHPEKDTYSQAGTWLMGTARRNPEALLLLAAGCVLLMRSAGSSASKAGSYSRQQQSDFAPPPSTSYRGQSNARQGLSRAVESAADYASDIKDQVADTASDYAETVSEFAGEARRKVSEQSERFARQAQSTIQSTMARVLREQPLVVAAVGLAAGAAVAAAFPTTDVENRILGGAREALTDAASKVGENVMQAAGKAGERLKSAAQEGGLTPDGLKKLAGEVADTFADGVSGKSGERGPPTVKDSPSLGSSAIGRDKSEPGSTLGRDKNEPGKPGPAPAYPGSSRRSDR
jgi:gas vesicle protein